MNNTNNNKKKNQESGLFVSFNQDFSYVFIFFILFFINNIWYKSYKEYAILNNNNHNNKRKIIHTELH